MRLIGIGEIRNQSCRESFHADNDGTYRNPEIQYSKADSFKVICLSLIQMKTFAGSKSFVRGEISLVTTDYHRDRFFFKMRMCHPSRNVHSCSCQSKLD